MRRYLTPQAKAHELREWSYNRSLAIPERPDRGGLGYPDPEIFSLCDRLNAIPGVCTLQSCAGHHDNSHAPSLRGNLWLWLDCPTAQAFEVQVPELVVQFRLIDYVRKLWMPDTQEIIDIGFAPHYHPHFVDASNLIVSFFRSLRALPQVC